MAIYPVPFMLLHHQKCNKSKIHIVMYFYVRFAHKCCGRTDEQMNLDETEIDVHHRLHNINANGRDLIVSLCGCKNHSSIYGIFVSIFVLLLRS